MSGHACNVENMTHETSNPVCSDLTIAIPTFGRHEILVSTLQKLLQLSDHAACLMIIDQNEEHDPETDASLTELESQGQIQWIRQKPASITQAMNRALLEASTRLVLFLDDDIIPFPGLIAAHAECHRESPRLWATVGQVIQPWQSPTDVVPPRKLTGLRLDFDFPFHSNIESRVFNAMAGNLCVNRERALSIGGFDNNFIGSAYRFETDFARRIGQAGGAIHFCAQARIDHLRIPSGGTRTEGNHLASANPRHGIGDYYYAFQHGGRLEKWVYSIHRLFREVSTKFHLTHPWWIPVKFVGELRAFLGGYKMARAAKQAKRTA